MVRRIFWMAVGAGATVWAMNKANEAVHRLTPDSLSGTAARGALHLGDLAKQFAQDVRTGMTEREEQLREDLGLDGTAVVEPSRRRPVARPPPCLRPAVPAPRPRTVRVPPPKPSRERPGARFRRGAVRTGRTTNGVGRDPPPLAALLRGARPHRRSVGVPGRRRPHPAAGQRRHGAVQAVLPGRGQAAVLARHQRPEVRADPGHRGGREDHPARLLLPDVRQLLLRRLLQGRSHQVRLGAAHQFRRGRWLRPGEGEALDHRLQGRRRGRADLA